MLKEKSGIDKIKGKDAKAVVPPGLQDQINELKKKLEVAESKLHI